MHCIVYTVRVQCTSYNINHIVYGQFHAKVPGKIRVCQLLGKSPLPHKTLKNNAVSHCQWARADEMSLFKAFLHNYGRTDILSKQLKKIKQDKRMYATFPKSQKTHGQI